MPAQRKNAPLDLAFKASRLTPAGRLDGALKTVGRGRIRSTVERPRGGDLERAEELVRQRRGRVSDVQAAVVIRVRRVVARQILRAQEKRAEEENRIADAQVAVAIGVAAPEIFRK